MSKLSLMLRRTYCRKLKFSVGLKGRDIGDLAMLNIWSVAVRKAAKLGVWGEADGFFSIFWKSNRPT